MIAVRKIISFVCLVIFLLIMLVPFVIAFIACIIWTGFVYGWESVETFSRQMERWL